MLKKNNICLMIVDMQNYFILDNAPYVSLLSPEIKKYLLERCNNFVIPEIKKVLNFFRENKLPIIFLRLCSKKENRSDMQIDIRKYHNFAKKNYGIKNLYPLYNEYFANIVEQLAPFESEIVIDKTTFSPFTKTKINSVLKKMKIKEIVITGLATSQCVETTARDAIDRNYKVYTIEKCLTDYNDKTHNASLITYHSMGIEIYCDFEEFKCYLF